MTEKRGKICKHCEEEIDLNVDKHVLLGTYTGNAVDDESYFHFHCFVEWYNKKVNEKAKNSVKDIQKKAEGIFNSPMLSGLLGGIGGMDKIKGMVNLDLSSEMPDFNELLGDKKPKKTVKKQDGKPRTKSTKK